MNDGGMCVETEPSREGQLTADVAELPSATVGELPGVTNGWIRTGV